MAKPFSNDLVYGHFGQAIYSTEHGSWSFDRRPGHRGAFHQLDSWKRALGPAKQIDDISNSEATDSAREVQQVAKSLGRSQPQLVASLELLPDLALVSAAVTSTADTYDPAVGDLLSFGSFTPEGHSKYARLVAAVPAGEAGNILRLIMLSRERHGWGQGIWLERPSLIEGESGYWVEDAAPIQQLCFAQTEDRSSFLLVRFPTKTVLFRPVYLDRRKPAMRSRFFTLPASRVDPRPILSIALEQTGDAPHADVAFNPDFQRQIGIVDQMGNWSIWDIEGGHRAVSNYSLSSVALGLITPADIESEDNETRIREDGWARILWIGDVNTILVCNRRRMEVVGIKGGETVRLKCFEPVPQRSVDWILDVKRHATNTHQFFVLTSTRLLLVAVTCQNDVLGNSDAEPGATVLLAWTHFRGPEDITLQLCVPTLPDDESKVLLFSRLNNLVTIFQSQNYELDPSRPLSSSDPMCLELGDMFEGSDTPRHITGLHVDRSQFREDGRVQIDGIGSTYMANDVRFYTLSVTTSDLSVHQALFYSHQPESMSTPETQLYVEPPSWNTLVQPSIGGFQSSDFVVEDDDFIVADGMETTSSPTLSSTYHAQGALSNLKSGLSPRTDSWTVNYGFMYEALVRGNDASRDMENSTLETEEISDVIARVKNLLLQGLGQEAALPQGTTFEFTESSISVPDIDNASAQWQNLFSHTEPPTLQQIAPGQVLHLTNGNSEDLSISLLYDAILENWIAPLPTAIPNRTRQSKERLARRIAAEVILASSRIRLPPLLGAPGPPEQSEPPTAFNRDIAMTLPVLPSRSSQWGLSQASLPSSHPVSSQQSEPSTPLFARHPSPIARLGQHLQITKPLKKESPNVNQILMHWVPGTDPSTYNWNTATQAVAQELGIEEDDGDEKAQSQKDKERLKRKAERLLKRQKRELDLSRRNADSQPTFGRDAFAGFISSPPPTVGMSSQTQGPSSQIQTQSQGGGIGSSAFPVVQSQVVPGRHGGRPAMGKKKKKKKGRVSGF